MNTSTFNSSPRPFNLRLWGLVALMIVLVSLAKLAKNDVPQGLDKEGARVLVLAAKFERRVIKGIASSFITDAVIRSSVRTMAGPRSLSYAVRREVVCPEVFGGLKNCSTRHKANPSSFDLTDKVIEKFRLTYNKPKDLWSLYEEKKHVVLSEYKELSFEEKRRYRKDLSLQIAGMKLYLDTETLRDRYETMVATEKSGDRALAYEIKALIYTGFTGDDYEQREQFYGLGYAFRRQTEGDITTAEAHMEIGEALYALTEEL